MTTIYLMRHGQAAPDSGTGDEARVLTARGQAQSNHAAQVLARLKITPKHIFTSPRTRTQQTAAPIADALGITPIIRDELDFGFGPDKLARLLAETDEVDLLLVGHEPTMSGTIRRVCGADVAMEPGMVACVDLYSKDLSPQGVLRWLIAPNVFDAIAEG
ncbi:MAG: histidine phosphatase family protein [Chloroflexota bacterium]